MKYTVVWRPSVERALADMWNNASDRAGLSAAADELDESLRNTPLLLGESRGGITRIATVPPITVLFDVDVADRKVIVWDLWRSS